MINGLIPGRREVHSGVIHCRSFLKRKQNKMRYGFLIVLVLLVAKTVHAQEAVQAFASGENSFLLFTKEPCDTTQTYTVICFAGGGKRVDPIPGLEKVANVVPCVWNTEQDANAILTPYNIHATAGLGKTLQLTGSGFSLNTTSAVAYLVLLDSKPQLLCCGADCHARLNDFFR